MSEKFKELLAVLMAYNIPFRFRDRAISTKWCLGFWLYYEEWRRNKSLGNR